MPVARAGLTPEQISAIDAAHLWHPYSTIGRESVAPMVAVGAHGAWLTLIRDGRPIEALDAMSSWWTAIHGRFRFPADGAVGVPQVRGVDRADLLGRQPGPGHRHRDRA